MACQKSSLLKSKPILGLPIDVTKMFIFNQGKVNVVERKKGEKNIRLCETLEQHCIRIRRRDMTLQS